MKHLEIKRLAGERVLAWPTWVNLLAIACVIVLIATMSIWTAQQSESTLRANVASKLSTILKIESEAVRQWLKSEKTIASFLAEDEKLAEMLLAAEHAPAFEITALNGKLIEMARKLKGKPCLLMNVDGQILAQSGEQWLADQVGTLESQICETLVAGDVSVSPVFTRVKSASGPSFIMVVLSPIQHPDQGTVGFLGIGLNAQAELTDVLASSRTGETGETIAVSEAGHLISHSRFDDGTGKVEFFLGADGQAINRQKSSSADDLIGKANQRSADVAFVARWMPRLGLGLVTKMDRSEAFAPVVQIRQFIWTLCGLLTLTTISTVVYRGYIFRLRKIAKQSDLNRKRLGAYELEEKIGEGGMGVVYRARHALLRRPTAIKILPPEKSNQISVERFEREVQYTSQLKHPNTISIFDYGRTENGLFYYAMELLDGLNLEQLIRLEGPLPDGRVVAILRQVCGSLREAHELAMIHRDIKPANIMLCDHGGAVDTVKVLDFGMVRDRASIGINVDGSLSGTPTYMAPECFTNPAGVDARVDVFAVGAVGFFLLTGKPLLAANSRNELLSLHQIDLQASAHNSLLAISDQSKCPISPELTRLISRCVSSNRSHRFDSVDEILEEFSQCRPLADWDDHSARKWWKNRVVADVPAFQNIPTSNGCSLHTTHAYIPPSVKPVGS